METCETIHVPEYPARFSRIHPKLWHMRRTLSYQARTDTFEVSGGYWSCSLVFCNEPNSGFCQGNQTHLFKGWSAIFVPPFSIVKWHFLPGNFSFDSYFSTQQIPVKNWTEPFAVLLKTKTPPKNPDEIFELLKHSMSKQIISYCPYPNSVAKRAKEIIVQQFSSSCDMSSIAEKLKISPTLLARYFKKSFGITPLRFRNTVRVRDALRRLLFSDKPITQIGFDVGFGDLSQLHRNFHRVQGLPPKRFRC